MAQTDALSVMNNTEKDKLMEIKGKLIEAIQKIAKSEGIKNKLYSGELNGGSVEASRFINAVAQKYGTARTAGKGTLLNNKGKVTVNLDQHKEIVEEVSKFDVDTIGIPGIVEARKAGHVRRMIADLDKAFFTEAETAGTAVTLTGTTAEDKMEELIQSLEALENEYVDGVDRELMVLSLTPKAYGALRNHIDKVQNANIESDVEEIEMFHGVRVISNHRQTKDAILMVIGAIAQPIKVYDYDVEKINLSNNFALELFYDYGTKAIAPDLIKIAELK